MKILGIDPGAKRVGLAIADSELGIATGLTVIQYKNKETFIENLRKIVYDEDVELLVVGLPINMDGSEGTKATEARNLAATLERELNIEVRLVDESLTSFQAERQVHAASGKVGKKRKQINMIAATLILQEYLDNLSS
jgi:putative Holliday junction resolvase